MADGGSFESICSLGHLWSAEFTDALCPTQWVVAEGKLQLKGEIEAASKAEKLEWKPQEEQIDAFGNVVKIKVVCLLLFFAS